LRLHGYYAFSVRGFDPNGLFVAAGSFLADGNGNISGGIADINNTTTLSLSQSFSGTYSIYQNGLGIMTLNLPWGGAGSHVFALSMMADGDANIIEFDDSTGGGTRNSGVLLRQDTSAFSTPFTSGNYYAFGFLGIDSNKNRFGVAGDFQAVGTGTAGTFQNGLLDSDDASSGIASSVPFTGTYTSSNGRVLATIGTSSYSFYVVNSTELLVVEIDPFVPGGANSLVSGTILPSGSDFNPTSVFELTGLDASGPTAESQVGLFEASSGNFTLTSDQNSGGTVTSTSGSGTYSIANGRVTLTGTGFQNSQPVLYLVSPPSQAFSQAFIIGTDPAVSFGFLAPQSGAPFTDASLSGLYAGGSLAPVDPSVSNVVSIALAGSGTLNVNADISSANGLSLGQDSLTTSVASTGRVVVQEKGNQTEILYLVSPAEFFALSADPTDPTARVDIFQQ
jgi:hypothetical protein